ncbi:MAG: hypothetical protein IMY72_02985 [Bacteroidetes bacterium]|nr:hypothetical protein [Bacteroidota bacterium]
MLFFCVNISKSQDTLFRLNIIQTDTFNTSFIKKINYKDKLNDTISANKELKKILQYSFSKGFLSSSFDSIFIKNNNINAYLYLDKQYFWNKLLFKNIDNIALKKAGLKNSNYCNKPINYNQLTKIKKDLIQYYENSGYPFASVQLTDVSINRHFINADLDLNKNNLITIDSIYIKGNAKISKNYIYKYIDIKPKDLYNEKKIKEIKFRINELKFINISKPYEVTFARNKSDIYLYLDKKNANQFNGIIGLLPDKTNNNKLSLTGQVKLLLLNSLGKGESFFVDWSKLKKTSQELTTNIIYPYIFSSPIGINFNFNLLKQDTSYLTINTNFGLQFLLNRNNYIKTFLETKNSKLLSTKNAINNNTLNNADFNTIIYGLSYKFENLNYGLNPRNGFDFFINIGIGEKKIKKNSKLSNDIYNNYDLKTSQVNAYSDISYYFPVYKNIIIKLQNQSGIISNINNSNKQLVNNELFRIGGLNTIRGFDEKSILASSYSIIKIECRYLLNQNSNFIIFYDEAYYEKQNEMNLISDFPFDFGFGINFQTKAGVFSTSYAIGKQFNQPLKINNAKINFGYTNKF